MEPVERFHPTSGRAVGYLSLAAIAGLVVYLAVTEHSMTGLRLGTGLVFLACLVWVTQLRPRAAAYPDALHLQNALRDATVPLAAIDRVEVGRVLQVRADGARYVCIGIGTPLRKMVRSKSRGPSMLLGWDRLEAFSEASTPLRPDQSAMAYQEFVETRIAALVEDAKRRSGKPSAASAEGPRRRWAWPEIAALAATAALFVTTLLL
jgi:hypothetical protein